MISYLNSVSLTYWLLGIIAAAAIVWAAIAVHRKIRFPAGVATKLSGFFNRLLAGEHKDMVALACAYIVLELMLWNSNLIPQLYQGYGLWHLAAVPATLFVVLLVTEQGAGHVAIGMALAALALLLVPQAEPHKAVEPIATKTVAIGTHCTGRKVEYRFGSTEPAVPFNPAGQCAPDLWTEGRCIMVRPAGKAVAKVCPGDPFPKDVASAWSAGAPFDGYVSISPPRYQSAAK